MEHIPEPEPGITAPPIAHPAAEALHERIEEELRTHRSAAPAVIPVPIPRK